MIKSYKEYINYLEADRISLNRSKTLKAFFFDDVWKFQRLMRRLEYLTNCKKNCLIKTYVKYKYMKYGQKLGFTIPINTFGPGLAIAHSGTIVVNGATKVGSNCRLHVCVNIGTEAGKSSAAPLIGDNCYIGPGVKMFGNINIGSNTAIGANAVVNKSFPIGNITIAGIPAKIISTQSSSGLLIKGYHSQDTI